jgi:hypothetical protein
MNEDIYKNVMGGADAKYSSSIFPSHKKSVPSLDLLDFIFVLAACPSSSSCRFKFPPPPRWPEIWHVDKRLHCHLFFSAALLKARCTLKGKKLAVPFQDGWFYSAEKIQEICE